MSNKKGCKVWIDNTKHASEYSLSTTEYKKLLEVCQSLEEEVMLKLGVACGFRRKDLAGVLIKDVDLTNHTITYYENKKDKIRTIPIGKNLTQLLIKYLKTIPQKQKHLIRWRDRTLWTRLQLLCDKADIPRRPFHALRGTCIKFCLKNGWSSKEVAELVGDSIWTIDKYYTIPSKSEMHEVADEKEIV